MTANTLPPLMILLFGCLFVLLGLFYPWLGRALGVESGRPERRFLSLLLGAVLLALWALYKWVLQDMSV